jgi:hypothetical protein
MQVEDEALGGQQGNFHLILERERKAKAKGMVAEKEKGPGHDGGKKKGTSAQQAQQADAGAAALVAIDPEAAQLEEAFRAAANAVAEANMALEDRIARWLKRWCKDWEADLEGRPEEVKASATGRQADIRYKETMEYLRPLFIRLKGRSLHPEMLAGIKLVVEAMRDRNYLYANKVVCVWEGGGEGRGRGKADGLGSELSTAT